MTRKHHRWQPSTSPRYLRQCQDCGLGELAHSFRPEVYGVGLGIRHARWERWIRGAQGQPLAEWDGNYTVPECGAAEVAP